MGGLFEEDPNYQKTAEERRRRREKRRRQERNQRILFFVLFLVIALTAAFLIYYFAYKKNTLTPGGIGERLQKLTTSVTGRFSDEKGTSSTEEAATRDSLTSENADTEAVSILSSGETDMKILADGQAASENGAVSAAATERETEEGQPSSNTQALLEKASAMAAGYD